MKHETDMVVMSVNRQDDDPKKGYINFRAPMEGGDYSIDVPQKDLGGWGALVGRMVKVTVESK